MDGLELRSGVAGHRVAYRVAGAGPALVLIRQGRHPREVIPFRLLTDRFRVVQVDPLGFGASDRPADPPPLDPSAPVLAVLDREGIDRFAIWGYSQGAALAAAVARGTGRVVGMIAGGNPLLGHPTDAERRRLDRDPRVPAASRAFWHWYGFLDWARELTAMHCPRLVYVGGADRAPRVRRVRERLQACGVDVIELEGLDHRSCSDPVER